MLLAPIDINKSHFLTHQKKITTSRIDPVTTGSERDWLNVCHTWREGEMSHYPRNCLLLYFKHMIGTKHWNQHGNLKILSPVPPWNDYYLREVVRYGIHGILAPSFFSTDAKL